MSSENEMIVLLFEVIAQGSKLSQKVSAYEIYKEKADKVIDQFSNNESVREAFFELKKAQTLIDTFAKKNRTYSADQLKLRREVEQSGEADRGRFGIAANVLRASLERGLDILATEVEDRDKIRQLCDRYLVLENKEKVFRLVEILRNDATFTGEGV